MFGETTDGLIRDAWRDKAARGVLTMEQRTLLALSDGEWHGARELALTVSHRFGGYLHTLKERGVEWEKRHDPDAPAGKVWWQYRLVRDTGPQTVLF